jgi:alkylation response protein AidB-like acyl-CoA dehydrogenase
MARLDAEMLDQILTTLRDYAATNLPTNRLLEIELGHEFPEKVMKDLYDPGQIGLHLLTIPEEFGGLGGGAYDIYRVSEAMASIDLGIATGVLATFLGTDPINVGATPEQKKDWLSALAEHGHFYAYGATEPQAGSDLGALTTTAVPVEENGKAASSGSATAASPTATRSSRTRRAGRRGSSWTAGPRASPTASPRTSTASAPRTPPRSSSRTCTSRPTG